MKQFINKDVCKLFQNRITHKFQRIEILNQWVVSNNTILEDKILSIYSLMESVLINDITKTVNCCLEILSIYYFIILFKIIWLIVQSRNHLINYNQAVIGFELLSQACKNWRDFWNCSISQQFSLLYELVIRIIIAFFFKQKLPAVKIRDKKWKLNTLWINFCE